MCNGLPVRRPRGGRLMDWSGIGDGFVAEFSDLTNARQVAQALTGLVLAGVLGGLLGWQRIHWGKAAGLRTHILVAIGAAFFAVTPRLAGFGPDAVSRVLQGRPAAIGFLGAGAILKQDHEGRVVGLTTAAGRWLTAAVGVAAGLGHGGSAVACTAIALFVLVPLEWLEEWAGAKPRYTTVPLK